MGRPIMHFEIAATDLGKAADFYRELFGWTVGEGQVEGYRLVETAEESIGGGLLRTPEGLPVRDDLRGVEDLWPSLREAEELGGKVVVEPMPIPGVGAFAMFRDPDGVVMGLFKEQAA